MKDRALQKPKYLKLRHEKVVSLSKYVLQLLDKRFPKDKEIVNTKASNKTKKMTKKATENKKKYKIRLDRAEHIYQPLVTPP